jgi:hypothetical protein
MIIKYGLAEQYFRADQIHLAAIWKENGNEHILFLEPNLDFKLEDGCVAVIQLVEHDVHGHLHDIEIVEYVHEDEL